MVNYGFIPNIESAPISSTEEPWDTHANLPGKLGVRSRRSAFLLNFYLPSSLIQ